MKFSHEFFRLRESMFFLCGNIFHEAASDHYRWLELEQWLERLAVNLFVRWIFQPTNNELRNNIFLPSIITIKTISTKYNVNTFQLLTLQIMSKNSITSRARFFFYLSTDNNHFTCQLYFLLRLSSSHMDAIFSNVLPFFLLFESNYQNLLIDWNRRGIIKTMKHSIALPVMSYHWSLCMVKFLSNWRREEICCFTTDEIEIIKQMFSQKQTEILATKKLIEN